MSTIILPRSISIATSIEDAKYPELWKGLVGAWSPSLGYTGGKLIDYSGRKNHGILTNMDPATDWVLTEKGLAFDFDGTNDYLLVPASKQLNIAHDITLMSWFRPASLSGTYYNLFEYNDSFSLGSQFYVTGAGVGTNTYALFTNLVDTGGASHQYESSAGLLSTNQWYAAGLTRRGAVVQFYLNGMPVNTSVVPASTAIGASDLLRTNFQLILGCRVSTMSFFFVGHRACDRVYSRSMSAEDMQLDWSLGPGGWAKPKSKIFAVKLPDPPPTPSRGITIIRKKSITEGGLLPYKYPELWKGLVGAWSPCLGYTGSKLIDYSGRKNHGILVNMDPATDWVRTSKGWVLDFDNTTPYIEISKLPQMVLTDTTGWTICGWFRPYMIDSTWHSVISKVNSNNTNRQIYIGINGGYSTTTNGLSLFTNSNGDGAVGTSVLTAGRLYFFCATHLGTGAGANRLSVWSQESGWMEGTSGVNPTLTQMDSDNGTNPLRIGRFDYTILPLGGYVSEINMYVPGDHKIAALMQSIGPGGWAQLKDNTYVIPSPFIPKIGGISRRKIPFLTKFSENNTRRRSNIQILLGNSVSFTNITNMISNGNVLLSGNLNVNSVYNLSSTGSLQVVGQTQFNNSINVNYNSASYISGNTSLNNFTLLSPTGSAQLLGQIVLENNLDILSRGSININGNTSLNTISVLSVNGFKQILGQILIQNNLDLSCLNGLNVSGNTSLNSIIVITPTGNIHIIGNSTLLNTIELFAELSRYGPGDIVDIILHLKKILEIDLYTEISKPFNLER